MSRPSALTGRSWVIPLVVVAVAAVVIALLLWPGGDEDSSRAGSAGSEPNRAESAPTDVVTPGEQEDGTQDSQTQDFSFVETREEEDPLALGPVDAPVTMVVFSDYQCPYCASWSQDTLPAMMDYVEAGDLRIEWRDLNVYGPPSVRASKAAYAAGVQDSFMEYHHELFPEGEHLAEDQLTREALVGLAGDLGLDVETFREDMTSQKTADQIETNSSLGTDLGLYSTPGFVIDGEPMVGAQPTEQFTQRVDQALVDAGA